MQNKTIPKTLSHLSVWKIFKLTTYTTWRGCRKAMTSNRNLNIYTSPKDPPDLSQCESKS